MAWKGRKVLLRMGGLQFCPVFTHICEIMSYWLQGTGDTDCHFKIKRNLENASVSLESLKSPGLFVGLQPDGQAKPVIYTKDENVCFYPRVIQCMFTQVVWLYDGLCRMSETFSAVLIRKYPSLDCFFIKMLKVVWERQWRLFPSSFQVINIKHRVLAVLKPFMNINCVCTQL